MKEKDYYAVGLIYKMLFLQNNNNRKSGFTLVELLTVVSILSLLGSSVLVNFQDTRARARDVRRLEDVQAMLAALTLYYDADGHFPCVLAGESSLNSDFLSSLVTRGYIDKIPRDPINNSDHYYTYYSYRNVPSTIPAFCGQIAHIDVDFEINDKVCPFGKFKNPGYGRITHCHIYYPTGIPTNFPPPDDCNDPYSQNTPQAACYNFADSCAIIPCSS